MPGKVRGWTKGNPLGASLRLIDVLQDASRIAQKHFPRRARTDSLMVASLRYHDKFVKTDGAWQFAERLLYVDWVDERPLS